eukprot:805744-Prymnesium_polylepis.1
MSPEPDPPHCRRPPPPPATPAARGWTATLQLCTSRVLGLEGHLQRRLRPWARGSDWGCRLGHGVLLSRVLNGGVADELRHGLADIDEDVHA